MAMRRAIVLLGLMVGVITVSSCSTPRGTTAVCRESQATLSNDLPAYPCVELGELMHAVQSNPADPKAKWVRGEPFVAIGKIAGSTEDGFVLRTFSVGCCTGYTVGSWVEGAPGAFADGMLVAVYGRLKAGPYTRPDVKADTWLEQYTIVLEQVVDAERLLKRDSIFDALDFESATIFRRALEASGLSEQLHQAESVTVLVPIDQAFDRLGEARVDALFEPENRALLQQLVRRHVLVGSFTYSDLMKIEAVESVSHEQFPVHAANGRVQVSSARFLLKNVRGSNGMAHIIHTVLMPEDALVACQHEEHDE
jgi:uncharacterized surface protein with fasciclin (FAS1) repeats